MGSDIILRVIRNKEDEKHFPTYSFSKNAPKIKSIFFDRPDYYMRVELERRETVICVTRRPFNPRCSISTQI